MAKASRLTYLPLILIGLAFLFRCTAAFIGNNKPVLFETSKLLSTQKGDDTSTEDFSNTFSDDLIQSLDLLPLTRLVARHAGTRRGYNAILSLVNEKDSPSQSIPFRQSFSQPSRRQRAYFVSKVKLSQRKDANELISIAKTAEEARHEYELVEQATLALQNNPLNLTYPPLYGKDSNPMDTERISRTDDDDWLDLAPDDWSLESIIQAEQVIETLRNVKAWAGTDECMQWLPMLSEIGLTIDNDNLLRSVYEEIQECVKILRVRSLTDPSGQGTYTFRLNEDKFPILGLLRKRENNLLVKGGKEFDKAVLEIQSEIERVEFQIQSGLAETILRVSKVVDEGLDIISKLDIVFSKAAFGLDQGGMIPIVSDAGKLSVSEFVHPLLDERAVPIDLELSPQEKERVLIISGPNGGGKTLALKSFGVVCTFAKLGIPIPVRQPAIQTSKPRIDFFENVLGRIGDHQSLLDGESTWTGMLNLCASIIDQISNEASEVNAPDNKNSYLVLLDELGSGTDPDAGGAISQAILEYLMSNPSCYIVATTHSPRLKALSYKSSKIGCASVLLKRSDQSTGYNLPSFKLEYGVIGESHAMGAASRCNPIALPEQVLARSSQLLSESSGKNDEYFRVLTESMERQLERASEELVASEINARDSAKCRSAMISLAESYEQHLSRLETRLNNCLQQLKTKGVDNVELVGETIAELRIVQKKIQGQKEFLREQGLKLLPTSHRLTQGEAVVIVSDDGEWDSTTATVVADSIMDPTLRSNEVLVQSSSLSSWTDESSESSFVVQRHNLAIWDYDSVWDEQSNKNQSAMSTGDASLRLTSLLSNLGSNTKKKTGNNKISGSTSFTSTRERKAARKKKGKKKS